MLPLDRFRKPRFDGVFAFLTHLLASEKPARLSGMVTILKTPILDLCREPWPSGCAPYTTLPTTPEIQTAISQLNMLKPTESDPGYTQTDFRTYNGLIPLSWSMHWSPAIQSQVFVDFDTYFLRSIGIALLSVNFSTT